MAAPVDPLAWINENPLLLAVGSGVVVAVVTAIPKTTRRFWIFLGRGIRAALRWLFNLRVVPRERVRPTAGQAQRANLMPVRWVVGYRSKPLGAGFQGFLGNTASGLARNVRVDDGSGTKVYGDAAWPDGVARSGVVFDCWVDEMSALAGLTSFSITWTDALGQSHYESIPARPAAFPEGF